MGEVLSIQEMISQYKGEWLLIAYAELDDEMSVIRGEVLAHSPDRDKIYRELLSLKGKSVAVDYAGLIPEDLAVHDEDAIVMGIFSRVPSGTLRKSWVRIEDRHPGFPRTGIKKTSLFKAEKVAVVHEFVFQRKLGSLPSDVMTQAQEALKRALLIS